MSRSLRLELLGTLLLAGVPLPALAQQDFDNVEIRATRLADGLFMLEGAGGNMSVCVGADGAFLIDDQFAPLSPRILAAIHALDPRPLRFVLNTHWHGDHTGGNLNMAQAGAVLVAHDSVRRRLSTEQFNVLFGRRTPPAPHGALPIVTFSKDITFHLNGREIHAFHLPPAHTDGDVIVRFPGANVIHASDVFFNRIYPVIDVAAGGSLDGMIGATERVLALADDSTRIVAGHGPLGDKASLRRFHDMMVGVRDAIRPMVAAGKSADEIVAAKPTAPWDAEWAGGHIPADAFVRMAVAGMTAGGGSQKR